MEYSRNMSKFIKLIKINHEETKMDEKIRNLIEGFEKAASEFKTAAEGINAAIFDILQDCVKKDMSFDSTAKIVAKEVPGWKLTKEDWYEMCQKEGKRYCGYCGEIIPKNIEGWECPYCKSV